MKKLSANFFRTFSLFLLLVVLTGFLPVTAGGDTESHDRLVALLNEAKTAWETVSDYETIFCKEEAENGVLGTPEEIYLKFEKPFKIFMRWLGPAKNGLQVLYEKGVNNGKLAIHQPKLLFGLTPVVFLDPKSPWVRQGSASYDIEDAGIGTFLNDFTKAVERGDKEGKLSIKFFGSKAEATFLNTQKDQDYFAYRVIVSFHPLYHLPVHMQLFDWNNKPIGVYSYRRLNPNVSDPAEFKRQIHPKLLQIYDHS